MLSPEVAGSWEQLSRILKEAVFSRQLVCLDLLVAVLH